MNHNFINEVVHLSVGGEIFDVHVMEDLIEIIDSEPRYDMGDNQSHSYLGSENRGIDGDLDVSSEDGSFILDSFPPPPLAG